MQSINTWYISIIMLDGIQETNYAWLSWNIILKIQKITNRIFCCDKKFSLAGVDVKYLFYIYLANGIRWKVEDHGVPHQYWSYSTSGIWVESWRPWGATSKVFMCGIINGGTYRPLVKTATNFIQQLQCSTNFIQQLQQPWKCLTNKII